MNERESAMTNPKSGAAEGKGRHSDALEELVALLRRVRFSGHDGPYVEGRHVAVLVDPCWNEDGKTIRVTIQCVAWGHRAVPWEGMPLFIYPSDAAPDQSCQLGFLNARGYTTLLELRPGEYRVMCSTTYGVSWAPVVRAGVQPPWQRRLDSIDKRVSTIVHQKAGGLYEVSAESSRSEKALENAVVLYAFAERETNKVRTSRQAVLRPSQELLKGKWKQPKRWAAKDPYETRFAFCVIPAQED